MKRLEKKAAANAYSKRQQQTIKKHIQTYFGKASETIPCGSNLEICVIPPTKSYNWYTLVTLGLGGCPTEEPEPLKGEGLTRSELVLSLPPEIQPSPHWITMLSALAASCQENRTWLGFGQVVPITPCPGMEENYTHAVLLNPAYYARAACQCPIHAELVFFYQVIPVYEGEAALIAKEGLDLFLEISTGAVGPVVDPMRYTIAKNNIMDDNSWHVPKIAENQFPLEQLAGYQHMAIFLRWCIENNLMSRQFRQDFADEIHQVLTGGDCDLRVLIRDDLNGKFLRSILNPEGRAFSLFYYEHGKPDEEPCYPVDIDNYADELFGEERCDTEMKTEGYLFVPYDEKYYQDMKQVIDQRYHAWKNEVRS